MPLREKIWGRVLQPDDIPVETEFEEQASKLNQGLKSCRALVSSYRTLLSSDAANDDPLGDERHDLDGPAVTETD
jgi:hypothetical protein